MKTPPSNSNSDWEKLLRSARADVVPPVDTQALLSAVRHAGVADAPTPGWTADFSALFGTGRVISSCLAAAAALALVATWQAWDVWQDVPWAQLLDSATGGGS